MVLESAWQVAGTLATYMSPPFFISAMLATSPFELEYPIGWARAYSKELKDKESSRSKPFGVPVLVSTLLWILVACCMTVPMFVIEYNSGAYNGWDISPFPLILGLATLFTSTAWLPIYMSECSPCANTAWVQLVSLALSIITFVEVLDFVKIYFALLVIPFIVWNAFWLIKVYVENYYQCGYNYQSVTCKTISE